MKKRHEADERRVRRGSIRRQNQRGFALLFIFAMAAAVAVMLYLEMPRVAFEHQRTKEALLVERGEQYVRGLTVYYRKNNKFPQTLDELERTNNIRFLRKRYRDPMTGKDEWRLIHVDAQGQYLDSLVHKPQGQDQQKQRHLLEADVQGVGQSAVNATEDAQAGSPFLQRRASDRIIPNTPGGPVGPGGSQASGQYPNDPQAAQDTSRSPQPVPVPGEAPAVAMPGMSNPSASLPGQSRGPIQGPGADGQGFNPGPGQGPNQQSPFGRPTLGQGGQQAQQGASGGGFGFGSGGFGMGAQAPPAGGASGTAGSQPQQVNPFASQGLGPGQPANPQGFGQGGFNSGSFGGGSGRQSAPQPGGPTMTANPMGAIQAAIGGQRPAMSGGFGSGGQTMGGRPAGPTAGGIAGVASTLDMEGIRVYNERTNYKEWEFLFDLKKAMQAMTNQGGGQAPMGQGGAGQRPGGQQGGSFGSGFGGSGSGRGGSFGQGGGQYPGGNQGGSQGSFGQRPTGPNQGGFGGGFGQQPPSNNSGSGFGFGGQSQTPPRR